MFVRMVDSRRYQLPVILASRQLQQFPDVSVELVALADRYGRDRGWLKALAGRLPHYNSWPQFSDGAMAIAKAVPDPANKLSPKDKTALEIQFNDAALKALAPTFAAASASTVPYELSSLRLLVALRSPLLEVQSVFRPWSVPNAEAYETDATEIALQLDELWPVFMAIIEHIRSNSPEGTWEGIPFGLPPTFLCSAHPDFDPSEEMQYECHLFLKGPDREVERWSSQAIQGRRERIQCASGSDRDGFVSISWGNTVWALLSESAAPDDDWMIKRVQETTLAAEVSKFNGFNERLFTALLDDAQSRRCDVPPDQLRDTLYRYHVLRQAMSGRSHLLFEFERQYYEKACAVYHTQDSIDSARHLGDLVLHLAEQKESKELLQENRNLQFIAIAFSFVALWAALLDSWNFVHGQPSDNDTSGVSLGMRLVFLPLITLVLLVMGRAFYRLTRCSLFHRA